MRNIDLIRLQLNHLTSQTYQDIQALSALEHSPNHIQTLQRLWDTVSNIHFLSEYLASLATNTGVGHPSSLTPPNNQRLFSLVELATYDGKNGNPAYVAVDGTVYDVTNNGAWAAATHFGLVAGRDYTREFSSCHAGQQALLAMLPVVGRLV